MSKTLVVVLSETRASELTFANFKRNVIDELKADLCVCIGVKTDYDYENPFYKLAKYRFIYDEPEDFGDAFDYAYNILNKYKKKYECLENVNALYGKIDNKTESSENIKYYGKNDYSTTTITKLLNECNDDKIVFHNNHFHDDFWKNKIYGIKKSDNNNLIEEKNVTTYKKSLH